MRFLLIKAKPQRDAAVSTDKNKPVTKSVK